MAAPPLKSLYKRELLVAPKLAFAMLGCPEVHAGIAERLRDKIKLTSSAPELVDFAALFGSYQTGGGAAEEDPLAGPQQIPPEPLEAKMFLRADLFSYYQRVKPGVVLALVPLSALTSGVTPWTTSLQNLKNLFQYMEKNAVRIVVSVVYQDSPPETAKMEEFASVLTRDLNLDPRQIQQMQATPTPSQLDELNLALQLYCEKACVQWQDAVYKRCQQLSMQAGSLRHLIRSSIKAAHFFELTHAWQSARARYGEAYGHLQAAMATARTACHPQEIRQLCLAADWVHLKLLLYAIGSGTIRPENVKSLHTQWKSHTRSFGAPLSGAHCALQSWHAEWLGRQHHALLAVMRMYCQSIQPSHLTAELQAHMLLEGALAAAAERQRLSPAVRAAGADLGVVLDTSTVAEGAWLGSLVQTGPDTRYLSPQETLAYLAWSESAVDHPSVMIALLDDCLMELPKIQGLMLSGMDADAANAAAAPAGQSPGSTATPSSPPPRAAKASHRHRYLSLIAQKGAQMMLLLQNRSAEAPALPQGWLGDSWALLAAAAVQFRRGGWHTLLAHTLEHSRECARRMQAAAALLICSLELSVVGRSLGAPRQTELCKQALRACAAAAPAAQALADAAAPATGTAPPAPGTAAGPAAPDASDSGALNFRVQWTNMSSGPPDRAGGSSVIDHGWLNVLNLSVSCAETGVAAGDVVVAVALRNMLPSTSTPGAFPLPDPDSVENSRRASRHVFGQSQGPSSDGGENDTSIPLEKVQLTVASDLGYVTLDAHPLDSRKGWLSCLGGGSALGSGGGVEAAAAAAAPGADAPYAAVAAASSRQNSGSDLFEGSAWRPDSARVGDFSTLNTPNNPSSDPVAVPSPLLPLPPLQPGEWTVFAARVHAAGAASVRMHEVYLSLGPATSVSFAVGQLCDATPSSESPGTTSTPGGHASDAIDAPPQIICGAPALGLASGLVGRDAPFGCQPFPSAPSKQPETITHPEDDSAASKLPKEEMEAMCAAAAEKEGPILGVGLPPLHLRAGVYSVELQHPLPPATLQINGLPGSMTMGECATATLLVTPHRTVSRGTLVWVQVAAKAAAAAAGAAAPDADTSTPPACRVFVGVDPASAVEVSPTQRALLPLPALAMGWSYMLRIWVVGVAIGGVVVEGGLDWLGTLAAGGTVEAGMRREVDVLEPFLFQAKFTATDGRAVALQSETEPGTVHVHRVPAASRCNMSLRMASIAPFSLDLRSVKMENLSSGWSLLHDSCAALDAFTHNMQCDDVYMAALSLCSPPEPGSAALGSLNMQLQRMEAPPSPSTSTETSKIEASDSKSPDDEEASQIVPDAVRACMLEPRVFMHALPRISVCPRMVEAWFEAHTSTTVGLEVPIKIKLGNCSDESLSLRVFLGTGSLGTVSGAAFQDVKLGAHEGGEARWSVSTQAPGMLTCLGTVQVSTPGKGGMSGGLEGTKSPTAAPEPPPLEFSLVSCVHVV